MPPELVRELERVSDDEVATFRRLIGRWRNFGKSIAIAQLGRAIATCDCLGIDVDGFIAALRKAEKRPSFVLIPDPKARS
jgi:hypothetical protein